MKIVIDSSVWIAGIGSEKGYAIDVIERSYESAIIEVFITDKILDEVATNLEKKLEFDSLSADQARIIVGNLCNWEINVEKEVERSIKVISYDPDKHILALCKKVQADFLITFDRKHLLPLKQFGQTKIVEPKDFIEFIEI